MGETREPFDLAAMSKQTPLVVEAENIASQARSIEEVAIRLEGILFGHDSALAEGPASMDLDAQSNVRAHIRQAAAVNDRAMSILNDILKRLA